MGNCNELPGARALQAQPVRMAGPDSSSLALLQQGPPRASGSKPSQSCWLHLHLGLEC